MSAGWPPGSTVESAAPLLTWWRDVPALPQRCLFCKCTRICGHIDLPSHWCHLRGLCGSLAWLDKVFSPLVACRYSWKCHWVWNGPLSLRTSSLTEKPSLQSTVFNPEHLSSVRICGRESPTLNLLKLSLGHCLHSKHCSSLRLSVVATDLQVYGWLIRAKIIYPDKNSHESQ